MGESGVPGGVYGCVKSWSGRVGGGFKSTIRLILVLSKLLIHLSAGGLFPVCGDSFQAFPH